MTLDGVANHEASEVGHCLRGRGDMRLDKGRCMNTEKGHAIILFPVGSDYFF